jgi:branched-chain amino acid transport system permease protein
MSGPVAVQAVLTGLALGVVFGLVGMGFSLIYGLNRVLSFAHGDLVVAAVFTGAVAVVGTTPVAETLSPAASVAMTLATLAAGAFLGAAVWLFAVRPFTAAGGSTTAPRATFGWVAGGITAGLAIRDLLGLILPAQAYAVPDPLHLAGITASGFVALPDGASLPARVFGVFGIGLVVALAVERLVMRSRVGLAIRAVASDAEAAAAVGIDTGRVALVTFVVAGLLAGLAGLLDAPGQALSVDAGAVLGLDGVAAALLGRLGSLRGALLGGLALGVVDELVVSTPALGAGYADVVPLAVLVAVLAARPAGLRSGRGVEFE